MSWLLCRLPAGQQVGLNIILKKQLWQIVVSSQNKVLSKGYIHYVKVDIRTNKPLDFRLRLSCSVSMQN